MMESGIVVEVEYDYNAELDDELTVHCGDVIMDVKKIERGWWEGTINGKRGLFPENFVKVLTTNGKSSPPKDKQNVDSNNVPLRKRQPGGNGTKRCRVLFSYVPSHDDELELKVDDVVDFMGEVEDGWWKGRTSGGIAGVFPSNFVELISNGKSKNDVVMNRNKRNESSDANGGNVQSELHLTLDAQSGSGKTKNSVQAPESSSRLFSVPVSKDVKQTNDHLNNAPKLPPKPVKELCRVLFPYSALNDDELTLVEGQTVAIISKEVEDKGWWKGEIEGKIGLFPDNFVVLLPPAVTSTTDAVPTPKKEKVADKPSVARSKNAQENPPSSTVPCVKMERRDSAGSNASDRSEKSCSGKSSPKVDDTASLKKPSQVANQINKIWHGRTVSSSARTKEGVAKSVSAQPAKKHSFGKSAAAPQRPAKVSSFCQQKTADKKLVSDLEKRLSMGNGTSMKQQEFSGEARSLTHLTASRNRGPKRRPPTTAIHRDDPMRTTSVQVPTATKTPSEVERMCSVSDSAAFFESGDVKPAAKAAAEANPAADDKEQTKTSTSSNKPDWLQELGRKHASRHSESAAGVEKTFDSSVTKGRSNGNLIGSDVVATRHHPDNATRPSMQRRPVSQPPPVAADKPNVPMKPAQVMEKDAHKSSAMTRLSDPSKPSDKHVLTDKLSRRSDNSTRPQISSRKSLNNQLNNNDDNVKSVEGRNVAMDSTPQNILDERMAAVEEALTNMRNDFHELRREFDEERKLRMKLEAELKAVRKKPFL